LIDLWHHQRETALLDLKKRKIMKVTQDGTIAIPTEIQAQLGFLPGTEVELKVVGNTLQLQKKNPPSRGQALVNLMRGTATAPLTTDEIMQLTRQSDD
jgi:bifunctional DNA-binding transcriptional regulator/antitoxin component of YhaV-PrlF toxin-antitoxin module